MVALFDWYGTNSDAVCLGVLGDKRPTRRPAACCLSDSGTIAEESSLLGFPAVTLRDSIERPEALDTGGIIMTGLHARDVVAAVQVAMDSGYRRDGISHLTPEDYLIDNTSERTVKFILSTTHRHHQWEGLRT